MATFLLTTLPTNDLGLLTRSLPIARELQALGHRAVSCNPAPAPRRLIADAGFENVLPDHPLYDVMAGELSLRGLVAYARSDRWRRRHHGLGSMLRELLPALPIRRAPATEDVWSMDHAAAIMGMLDTGFVRANCQALGEVIDRLDPDAVVDFWNPFAAMAARAAGKPLVTVIQADAHPRSQGFVWWKRPDAPPPSPVPAVNVVRAELGLAAISRLEELSVGDRTLVVGSPETDPLPPDAEVTYVGLSLWERAGARLPDWMGTLGRGGRPLVWVYSGNPHYGVSNGSLDSAVVLESCVAALADEPLDVVLTTGHHALPSGLEPLPRNFRHAPFLPGLAMAERCDLLVHHGGYGSCQAGLHAGKPAVILPTYSERESNARRLVGLGAALMVEVRRARGRKSVDPGALRAAVHQGLRDPSLRIRASDLGGRLRGLGGPALAARLIVEQALAGRAEHFRTPLAQK